MSRPVDTECPPYRIGARLANLLLDMDSSGVRLTEWIHTGDMLCGRAHQAEDLAGYHTARGFTDTLRDFLHEKGT